MGVRGNNSKQTDLYNTGMPGDNPFQSMYQATMCSQRAQTINGNQRARLQSQTPQIKSGKMAKSGDRWNNELSKSATKLGLTAQREQHRRFGEYHGEDGLEGKEP